MRFTEDEEVPLIIDAGSDMYDQQVEEQMAAAAALVCTLRLTGVFAVLGLSSAQNFRCGEPFAINGPWFRSVNTAHLASGLACMRYCATSQTHVGRVAKPRY